MIVAFVLFSIIQIGGTYAKAILLPNEVAIGAIGRIQVMSLSFCYCLSQILTAVAQTVECRTLNREPLTAVGRVSDSQPRAPHCGRSDGRVSDSQPRAPHCGRSDGRVSDSQPRSPSLRSLSR